MYLFLFTIVMFGYLVFLTSLYEKQLLNNNNIINFFMIYFFRLKRYHFLKDTIGYAQPKWL